MIRRSVPRVLKRLNICAVFAADSSPEIQLRLLNYTLASLICCQLGFAFIECLRLFSETYAWIPTESEIEWPLRDIYLICKG
jgi:hypothetical protein